MTVPGGYIAGDVLSATNMNLLPGGKMGYAAVTADQGTITAAVDLTSLTVTWTAVAARRYRTSFCLVMSTATVATTTTDGMGVIITDGSNVIKQECWGGRPPLVGAYVTIVGAVTETGLSGSTTRKLRGRSTTGSGTDVVTMRASATAPAFILVEDIGPA